MSILCPRCRQGDVAPYLLSATDESLFVCDECEATWRDDQLGLSSFLQLTVLLAERGLSPLWAELVPIDEQPSS